LAPYLISLLPHVPLFNEFATVNHTAALKLLTNTVLFGSLGAGKWDFGSGVGDSELEDCGE
jgi:hypothetical protein